MFDISLNSGVTGFDISLNPSTPSFKYFVWDGASWVGIYPQIWNGASWVLII
jgi:hypothetical protein